MPGRHRAQAHLFTDGYPGVCHTEHVSPRSTYMIGATMKKYILVVEDDNRYRQEYVRKLTGKFEVGEATTVDEARKLFLKHRDRLAGVIMDGCLGSGELNTLDLISEIRSGWDGRMIAASTNGAYRRKMIGAGCSSESAKRELTKLLPSIFE